MRLSRTNRQRVAEKEHMPKRYVLLYDLLGECDGEPSALNFADGTCEQVPLSTYLRNGGPDLRHRTGRYFGRSFRRESGGGPDR